MRLDGTVSEHQFGEALACATQDVSPLVRAQDAFFPGAWQKLLLDGDPQVRLSALKAAGGPLATQQISLTPMLY
jgi:hypothetical protein